MVKSKEWNWEILDDNAKEFWRNPSSESFYLLNRWKSQNKNRFLDLGCGLGRHSILFAKNDFETYSFDLSEEAVKQTKAWADEVHVDIDARIGDMLSLPYEDEFFDCIFCKNVISHTDTEGIKKIISELKRVLKKSGECYLTLGSKSTYGFKQMNWPFVDENTKLRMDDGPEKGIPHFYADYNLIKKLFAEFTIKEITHVEEFFEKNGDTTSSFHYHVLIRKD